MLIADFNRLPLVWIWECEITRILRKISLVQVCNYPRTLDPYIYEREIGHDFECRYIYCLRKDQFYTRKYYWPR